MKMRFKPTGEIIEIEDYCGQPTVCTSIPPKYQIKSTGEFVLCSDCISCENENIPYCNNVHDKPANFQTKLVNLTAANELEEPQPFILHSGEIETTFGFSTQEVSILKNVEEGYEIIINCEKITLTNNGIDILIPKDLGSCKSIIINGIKYTREG